MKEQQRKPNPSAGLCFRAMGQWHVSTANLGVRRVVVAAAKYRSVASWRGLGHNLSLVLGAASWRPMSW